MNIGMILENPFPPDVRVENEMKVLADAGHRIHPFALRFDNSLKKEEIEKDIFVYRLKLNRWFFNKLRVTSLRLPFYNFLWLTFLRKTIVDLNLDAIHTHDLPLAKVGRTIANEIGIPFILDLHENYPSAIKIWKHSKKAFGGYFLCPDKWAQYELEAVRGADRVVVVVEEAIDRFIEKAIELNKFIVVSNTLNFDSFVTPKTTEKKSEEMSRFIITYVGGFGPHRGLSVAIMAMPEILENISEAELVLVGDGSDKKELKNLVIKYGLEGKVIFPGWISMHDIPKYIQECDVCIIPYLSTEHTETTIPHKLFQYMYLKKPVLVSNCKPLARIVNETNAGLVFKSGNETEFMDCIIRLYKDQHLRSKMGENGNRAVLSKYNWQQTSSQLIQLYENLPNEKRKNES